MQIDKEKLADLYSYHPPVEPGRKEKHEKANQAAINFAVSVAELIDDPTDLMDILRKIQEARMLVNSSIALTSACVSYIAVVSSANGSYSPMSMMEYAQWKEVKNLFIGGEER